MLSSGSRWAVAALLLLGSLGTGCWEYNESPVVTEGPKVSMNDVLAGTEVLMHLVVTDTDGDELSYRWIQSPDDPAGVFSDPVTREPTWLAPQVTRPTSFLLKVNIRDGQGNSLVSSTTIQVRPQP